MAIDLILSSGFLAFAAQAGFLRGVEESGLQVEGVIGTSSGALAGAMWLAGMSADEVAEELSRRRPLAWVRPHLRPWRGAFSLGPVIEELRRRLPPRFEDLDRPFGVGVVDSEGTHELVASGSLPEAVAASCAIPRLFVPVELDGRPCTDGGLADRTSLGHWERWRPGVPAVLHLVDSARDPGPRELPDRVRLVRSPASGARLWSLGDFSSRLEITRARTRAVLRPAS